jgi:hypothetical protein
MNPDFISQAVDNKNRLETKQDVDSHRYQTRLLEKKKAFWGQIIHLKLRLEHGAAPETVTTWNIPRFRLTKEMLEDSCNRAWISYLKEIETTTPIQDMSKLALSDKSADKEAPKITNLVISHLYLKESNTVVMPDEMQHQCKSAMTYWVIVRSAGGISAGGLLACSTSSRRKQIEHAFGNNNAQMQVHYDGDLCFLLHNVPIKSQNGMYLVTSNDVRRWIVDGATQDDASVSVPAKRLVSLQQTLEKFQREQRGLVAMDSPSMDFVNDEIARTKDEIEKAQLAVEAARTSHFSDCDLSITLLPGKAKDKTSARWKVIVKGQSKSRYQKLIEKNKKWCLVPMYAFGNPDDIKQNRKSKAKHQHETDDFIMCVPKNDQVEHFVDAGGVAIEKLCDGFGILESYVTPSISSRDDIDGQHRLYHGHFREGAIHGEGTMYIDEGVYSGQFRSNQRCGLGKMEYSDGITLSGGFSVFREPLTVYSKGLPNGNVNIEFANGDEYHGEMQNGSITGRGVYKYAIDRYCFRLTTAWLHLHHLSHFSFRYSSKKRKQAKKYHREIEGEWINGVLQNNDGVEGQGCSNLLRSLLFDGERNWSA